LQVDTDLLHIITSTAG